MALPRYERDLEEGAGPRFRRLFLTALAVAALVGLVIGVLWVIAGLLNFHVFR